MVTTVSELNLRATIICAELRSALRSRPCEIIALETDNTGTLCASAEDIQDSFSKGCFMSEAFPAINSTELEMVTGGFAWLVPLAGTAYAAYKALDSKTVNCALGAFSQGFGNENVREYANCMLTGKLGDVPPPPSRQQPQEQPVVVPQSQ